MNKLSALSKLSSAYHHLANEVPTGVGEHPNGGALEEIAHCFHYIRRSLRLADLKPTPKDTEGLNGRMPTHF